MSVCIDSKFLKGKRKNHLKTLGKIPESTVWGRKLLMLAFISEHMQCQFSVIIKKKEVYAWGKI